MNYKDNLICFLAMLFWSVGFPAGEILLESWGTLSLIFFRTFVGVTLLFALWMFLGGFAELKKINWFEGIYVGGIGFGFGAILLLYGQQISDAVTPAIAVAMTPISGMLVEMIFDKRKLTIQIALGIIIVVFGGLMAGGIIFSEGNFNIGFFCCYSATLLFGWGTYATSKTFSEISAIGRTTTTLIGSLLFITVIYLIFFFQESNMIKIGKYDEFNLFLFFLFTIFSLSIAQSLWILGSNSLGVMFASLHMNAVPFYVMVIMFLFFNEQWFFLQALGATIVAIGVIVAQYRKKLEEKVTLNPVRNVKLDFDREEDFDERFEIQMKSHIKKDFDPFLEVWLKKSLFNHFEKSLKMYFKKSN